MLKITFLLFKFFGTAQKFGTLTPRTVRNTFYTGEYHRQFVLHLWAANCTPDRPELPSAALPSSRYSQAWLKNESVNTLGQLLRNWSNEPKTRADTFYTRNCQLITNCPKLVSRADPAVNKRMADLHYRITWLLPRPSGGQLVLFRHTKCMGNDYRGR